MKKLLIKALALLTFFMSPLFGDELDDWKALYSSLLQKYVVMGTKKGIDSSLVDYDGLRKDPNFRKALYDLARLPPFATYSKEEQLAMWINAYNILAMNVGVENPKIKSIKDAGSIFNSIWTQKIGVVSGTQYALDEIEKDIVRAKFQDPRAHFALNCASLSCPNIANYAYDGKFLDQQLNYQAQQFLNNRTKGMAITGTKLLLSKIFDWYAQDFLPSVKQWLANNGYIDQSQVSFGISYMNYDWSLNTANNPTP